VRFVVPAPGGTSIVVDQFPSLDVSRDGRRIAFVAADTSGVRRLYLREIGEIEPRVLPGTEEARAPFFSPDGRSVGFFSSSELKRVSLDGGAPIVLARVQVPRGAAWVDDATIALPLGTDTALTRISATGGAQAPLTELDAARNERTHRWPTPLPSGAVLFTSDTFESTEYYDDARIEAVTLDGTRRTVVVENASFARYLPTGHLLFARGGLVYAVPFDERALAVRGDPVIVLQSVASNVSSGAVQFAGADILVWVPGEVSGATGVVARLTLDGKAETLPIAQANQIQQLSLSPDGTRLAVTSSAAPNADLWVIDLARSAANRLSFQGMSWDPVWSPDGRSIAYASARDGSVYRPYIKLSDGSGADRLLWESTLPTFPSSFSPDGSLLLVEVRTRDAASDIWVLPLDGSAKPYPFVATPHIEWHPAFSPDGRWVAYSADDSGRNEIYVRPFPGPGGLWQVSNEGGHEPEWSPDGRRIFFRYHGSLFVVDVDTASGFSAGTPRTLLENPFVLSFNQLYSMTRDGQSAFVVRRAPDDDRAQIAVALDWSSEIVRHLAR
jgi:serine/threonine-protein kinase